jgi:acetyl esterase
VLGQPVAVDGQQLHPEVQLALKLLELAGEPELPELTVNQARERLRKDVRTFEGPKIEVERVTELQLAGAEGPLRARLYVPRTPGRGAAAADGDPALVFYHGGGFAVCDLDTHDNLCRFLAAKSGARVVSVDYRLAPEHRFPAAPEDALAALHDVIARSEELGIDPARVAVGGDSAGGNLAAGVAQAATREGEAVPAFQLLLYPWLDLSEKRRSYSLFRQGFYLTEADLDWYQSHYASDEEVRDPRCSPLLADELSGVAPAYIATAGFDPLRDEGEEYARRLRETGVPVALHRQAQLIHGFASTIGLGRVGREAMLEAAGALRMGLAARTPVAAADPATATG